MNDLIVGPLTEDIRKNSGMNKDETGVIIRSVTNGGLAAKAGLQPNDLILQINRNSIKDVSSFHEILKQQAKSKMLLLLIKRERGRFFVVLER